MNANLYTAGKTQNNSARSHSLDHRELIVKPTLNLSLRNP
jgi:hypothetical protein